MTSAEAKAKYARIGSDRSQITLFKNDFIDGKIGVAERPEDETKFYVLTAVKGVIKFISGDEPTPEPTEPEIEGSEMVLSANESIADNALLIGESSTAEISQHTLIV